MSIAGRRRLRVLSLLAASGCLVFGVLLQLLDRSPVVDVAGSVLYVGFAGMLLAALWPALSSAAIAAVAFAFAAAVELLQLTGVPQAIVAAFPPARLLFGSSFDPFDLLAYAGGAVLLYVAHLGLVRLAARQAATSAR
ncbi:MAG TPA: DUF2809 domain-containing protein [Agromyces sp.]|nr:DUF2809 domain-containing protein [Agromyces sp.]